MLGVCCSCPHIRPSSWKLLDPCLKRKRFIMKRLNLATFVSSMVGAFCLTATAQGKTIEIDVVNNQYVPPTRTLRIPPEFKEQGVRFALRAGDTLNICNRSAVFAKPFSYSVGNNFAGLA